MKPDTVNVPREPTREMLEAFFGSVEVSWSGSIRNVEDAYRAMLAAAPKAEPVGGSIAEVVAELVNETAPDQGNVPSRAFALALSLQASLASKPEAPKVEPVACGTVAIIPRKPTENEIFDIRDNINRKRTDGSDLTANDVREVIDNYFYHVGKPHPVPSSELLEALVDMCDWADEYMKLGKAPTYDTPGYARGIIAKHKGPQ